MILWAALLFVISLIGCSDDVVEDVDEQGHERQGELLRVARPRVGPEAATSSKTRTPILGVTLWAAGGVSREVRVVVFVQVENHVDLVEVIGVLGVVVVELNFTVQVMPEVKVRLLFMFLKKAARGC